MCAGVAACVILCISIVLPIVIDNAGGDLYYTNTESLAISLDNYFEIHEQKNLLFFNKENVLLNEAVGANRTTAKNNANIVLNIAVIGFVFFASDNNVFWEMELTTTFHKHDFSSKSMYELDEDRCFYFFETNSIKGHFFIRDSENDVFIRFDHNNVGYYLYAKGFGYEYEGLGPTTAEEQNILVLIEDFITGR
jgi:hypothetical protein